MDDISALNYAIQNGILDLDVIKSNIDMAKRKEYLEKHNSKIWQSTDGKWYTYLPDYFKGKKLIKRSSKQELENAIVNHYKKEKLEPTLENAFNLWIEEKFKLNEIKKGSYDRYKNDFKRFFKDEELKDVKVECITEKMLDDFIRKKLINSKLSSKAYSGLRTILIGVFKYCKRNDYSKISISTFFKDIDISKSSFKKVVKSKESQIFTEEEIPIIISWLKNHPCVMNYCIVLAFQTGLREGELAGLKFSDINNTTIHIQRQEIRYKEDGKKSVRKDIVDYTKTEAGNRYLIIPPQALETIAMIKKLNPDGEFLMMDKGRKLHAQSMNDYLYKACDGCNIPRRSMHKIRKTYGTILIDSGAEDSLVMSQMGHSDITTTRKYYYFSNKSFEHNKNQISKAISF